MKKYLILLIFTVIQSVSLLGQAKTELKIQNGKFNNQISTDSIAQGTSVFIGDSVTSFTASIIIPGGLCLEKHYNGNFIWESFAFKRGTIILVDQILSKQNGKQIRLPARKFIIR